MIEIKISVGGTMHIHNVIKEIFLRIGYPFSFVRHFTDNALVKIAYDMKDDRAEICRQKAHRDIDQIRYHKRPHARIQT